MKQTTEGSNMSKSNGTTATITTVEGTALEPVANIQLRRIERAQITVPVIGTSPLIVHAFDQKAKDMMLAAQQTKTRTKKAPKNPVECYEASMYRFADGGHGFPAVGFKAAMVDSARLFDGVKMTELRAALHVAGEGPDQLIRLSIDGEPRMREDVVRVGMGTADLRYRAEYWPWAVDLVVTFIPSMISASSVVALVDAAGLGGIGEWRPGKAKTGLYGTFTVAS